MSLIERKYMLTVTEVEDLSLTEKEENLFFKDVSE